MTKCAYCSSTILFGGAQVGANRYCNETCRQSGVLLEASRAIPDSVVKERAWKAKQGPCPRCHGAGPVDVYRSYWVWSALLLTRWGTTQYLSCRSCGRKAQLAKLLYSLLLGWWGFPWGLVITPMQIFRNVSGLMKDGTTEPSQELENVIRLSMGAEQNAQQPSVRA